MVGIVKTTLAVTGLLVANGAAQSWPQDFPACGVTCVTNMMSQTGTLGCNANDAKCFCANANFYYGVRDCSDQSCGNQQAAGVVQDYGRAYCQQAGQPTPTITTLNPSATNAGPGNGLGSSVGSQVTSVGNSIGNQVSSLTNSIGNQVSSVVSQASSAISTSAILSVVTNNGVVSTATVGASTIFGPIAGAIPSIATSLVTNADGSVSTFTTAVLPTNTGVTSAVTNTVPLATTITSGGSTFVTTTGTSLIASTSTRPNYAAQMTAAPGLLAAAGIAALLL